MMILIGQFDSPFVRRVGIALTLYGMEFEHRPWSVFGDAERIAAINPLIRVPVLVLESGLALIETASILDMLDGMVAAQQRLYPQQQPWRGEALRIAGLASGLSDKAVALFYELRLHDTVSEIWAARCRTQIAGALAALEADRAGRDTPFWFGAAPGHADVAVAASLRHAREAHPDLLTLADCPGLAAHCDRMEALPVFKAIYQPFFVPGV
jgi:glutathione S-transferase